MDAEQINKMIAVLSVWVFRAVALSSLVAHLFLVFLSDFRRRKASGGSRLVLWLAYQVNNWAPPYLLGNLYLETTPRDKQLFAFWVPFLLLHLARPDNMSAYTMEDNALSGRVLLVLPWQCVGAFVVVLRYIQIDSTAGTMRPASWIMLILGIFKYVESYLALKGGDLGNIRNSFKPSSLSVSAGHAVEEKLLEDEEALLLAHDLFDICKAAFSDQWVKISGRDTRGRGHFVWKNMCKVVEMELSLMYDLMYTKAAMVHTRRGYFIRVVSPPLTAAALTLFWFRYRDQVADYRDVVITFILVGTTLVLDVRWLLKAVVSTWAYALFKGTKWEHAVLCSGRWRRLRHLVVSLDPSRLSVKQLQLQVKEPSSYRMWSLTIGQHNLLRDFHDSKRLCSKLARSIGFGLEECWDEHYYSRVRGLDFSPDGTVRNDLFQQIWLTICKPMDKDKREKEEAEKKRKDGQPQEAHMARIAIDEDLGFDPELEEVVLIWHIATDVFLLLCANQEDDAEAASRRRTIKALSNYMMFLIAVRPGMLPGLKFRSVYETTHGALNKIWQEATLDGSHTSSKDLACILKQKVEALHNSSFVLSDGTRCALLMLTRLKTRWSTPTDRGPELKLQKKLQRWLPELFKPKVLDMRRMLDLIFNVWVRLLIYASIRCSRDSHAKQLGQGGELTTIVWIFIQHTRLFSEKPK